MRVRGVADVVGTVAQTTDCGAISNMYTQNHYVQNYTLAAAAAMNSGTDLSTECVTAPRLPPSLLVPLVVPASDVVAASAGPCP